MDFRSGSRVLEIALIAVIVAGTALNVAILSSSIPILAGLYARAGLALPLPLQLYIRAGNAAVGFGPVIALIVLGMWGTSEQEGKRFRDLSLLYLAAGEPQQAVALLEPRVTGDETRTVVRFASPGEAFLLAEGYRSANNIEAARRSYQQAQQAAVRFDQEVTERLLANQLRWRRQFGPDFGDWLPATSELRRLPDLIRSVSQQRLDQLEQK